MKRLIPLLALMVVVLGIPVSLVVLPRVLAANAQKEKTQDKWAKGGFTCTWYKQTPERTVAGVMEIPASKDRTVAFCAGVTRCVKGKYLYYSIAICQLPSDKLCSEIDPHECSAESFGNSFYFEDEKKFFEKRAKK